MDRSQRDAGFGMIELAICLLIATVMAGVAVVNVGRILPGMRSDEAMHQAVAQLRSAREQALGQRRSIEVRFFNGNQIQLIRRDQPAGTTDLGTSTLKNSVGFRLFGGVPDTPDAFGAATAVDFGAAASLLFLSDGTLVDPQGNPLNGSVFLGVADHPETARAVTVLGSTGRVRGYRWTGSSWIH